MKDIERVESYSSEPGFERRFAIILTNDSHYYDSKQAPSGTTDEDFVIHEGVTVKAGKTMTWHSSKRWATSLGSIKLHHDYVMNWELYSKATDGKGDFKYAITEITK